MIDKFNWVEQLEEILEIYKQGEVRNLSKEEVGYVVNLIHAQLDCHEGIITFKEYCLLRDPAKNYNYIYK